MNIFILDRDLEKCAAYHCDKHVVKMPLEYAQMLSTVVRKTGVDCGYRQTHSNHPCTLWVEESLANWLWLRELARLVNAEYCYRYGKQGHASWKVICSLPEPEIPDIGLTAPPQCMPEQYQSQSVILAYRNYYQGEKQHIASWSKRQRPEWFKIH